MIRKTIKVSDNNFRKFDDPLGNETPRKYIFYAKTCDVPEGIPMSTNPRDQKLNSTVANAITESLLSNDGQFHLKNRGIILSAKRVRYDNRLQEVTIDFEDESCHGNIDGGHTYKILLENKDKVLEQYVQFEVMTGVEAMIADLAEARNTSIAVDAKSMAELREKFDPIKEGLEGLPFFNRISFKQNQITKDTDTKKALKMIDARDIVSIICMFNIDKYNSAEHPTKAYSGKQAMLNEYLDEYDLAKGELVAEMVSYARKYLAEGGKFPYYMYRQKNQLGNLENVGYSKPGFESLYNLYIMEEIQTIISLGCGGVTKTVDLETNRIERIFNVKEAKDYIERLDEMLHRKDVLRRI